MIDAHCHLQSVEDLERVLDRAGRAGISGIGCSGTRPSDWREVAAIALTPLPFSIYHSFGVHPWFAPEATPEALDELRWWLERFPDAGVGEIGICGVHDEVPRETQERVFVAQLELAARMGRPVVLHGARAWDSLVEALAPYAPRLPAILAHGFNGSLEQLKRLLAIDRCFVSVGETIRNPHAKRARAACAAIPRERLLVETDAPAKLYGTEQFNEPALLSLILREAAVIRGEEFEDVKHFTMENGKKMLKARC